MSSITFICKHSQTALASVDKGYIIVEQNTENKHILQECEYYGCSDKAQLTTGKLDYYAKLLTGKPCSSESEKVPSSRAEMSVDLLIVMALGDFIVAIIRAMY